MNRFEQQLYGAFAAMEQRNNLQPEMAMATVTLTNDFHNTSVRIHCEVLSEIHDDESTIYPSIGQIKKAKEALCGIDGCTCSGYGGIRGRQEHNDKRLFVDVRSLFAAN